MITGGRATGSSHCGRNEAGWDIVYMPDAVVYYTPVGTYGELRSDYVRTVVAQERLCGDWAEPLPRGTVRRAAFASLRRQPLNAAAWAAVRARLWSERSRGRLQAAEGYARWDRRPGRPVRRPARSETIRGARLTALDDAPDELASGEAGLADPSRNRDGGADLIGAPDGWAEDQPLPWSSTRWRPSR